MHLSVEELLDYTDEERGRWEQWFRENGEDLLRMPLLGDRDNSIGALIRHVFGPELRFVTRLQGDTPAEYRSRPCHHIDELFGLGIESRKAMRGFVRKAGPADWDRTVELELGGKLHRATVRKIVLHVLLHEIRHWAQIARLMRERGLVPPGDHDLLTSAALL